MTMKNPRNLGLIFGCNPLNPREPDLSFSEEVEAATSIGFKWALIDHDALTVEHNAARAVRRTIAPSGDYVFRGWMMRPEEYLQLYAALMTKGIQLINDPASYQHTHYFPENYPIIAARSPKSVWLKTSTLPSEVDLQKLLEPFGDSPL